jgi:hypothetical protein
MTHLKHFQEYRWVSRNYVRFNGGWCGILYVTTDNGFKGIPNPIAGRFMDGWRSGRREAEECIREGDYLRG